MWTRRRDCCACPTTCTLVCALRVPACRGGGCAVSAFVWRARRAPLRLSFGPRSDVIALSNLSMSSQRETRERIPIRRFSRFVAPQEGPTPHTRSRRYVERARRSMSATSPRHPARNGASPPPHGHAMLSSALASAFMGAPSCARGAGAPTTREDRATVQPPCDHLNMPRDPSAGGPHELHRFAQKGRSSSGRGMPKVVERM